MVLIPRIPRPENETMAEEGKKISFGFAKSIKKPALKNAVVQQREKKVDYIECLDEKSIKVIGGEEKADEPLVIPLLGSKTWHDRIVNKIDADIFEPKAAKLEEGTVDDKQDKSKIQNGDASNGKSHAPELSKKAEGTENVVSLEEQAAKEIIEDLSSNKEEKKDNETLTLPLTGEESLRGEAESTLEDYEKIPVDAFGLAMLRGMGWQPGKGIGKNEKIVAAVIPELRPKGMGLGADKVTQKKQVDSKKPEEELKIEKGTFVKIIAGKQSDSYGQIEGFDDDAGRLIVKLALGGNIISLSEFMVQPVTKSEYSKNSKVLNAKKFEAYKDKEASKKRSSRSSDSSMSSEESGGEEAEDRRKNSSDVKRKSKSRLKSKSRRKRSSSNENDNNHKRKKAKRSRSSSSGGGEHKSKKSKKHKRQDSSTERSGKKHKKREREREKERSRTKEKKSRDSEHAERRKQKRHGRSRSRSRSRSSSGR